MRNKRKRKRKGSVKKNKTIKNQLTILVNKCNKNKNRIKKRNKRHWRNSWLDFCIT